MSAWLHAFVQHTHDFNQTRLQDPVEEHVRGFRDGRFKTVMPAVPNVKTSDALAERSSCRCR